MSRDVVLLDLFTCCVAPSGGGEMGSRPRITRDMIGDPLTDSFQHVAHVGATDASGIAPTDECLPVRGDFGTAAATADSRLAHAPATSSSSPPGSTGSSSRLPSPGSGTSSDQQQQHYLKLQMNSKGNGFDALGNPLGNPYQPVIQLPHLVNARAVGAVSQAVNTAPAVTAGSRY